MFIFKLEYEKLQGVSNLELICAEIESDIKNAKNNEETSTQSNASSTTTGQAQSASTATTTKKKSKNKKKNKAQAAETKCEQSKIDEEGAKQMLDCCGDDCKTCQTENKNQNEFVTESQSPLNLCDCDLQKHHNDESVPLNNNNNNEVGSNAKRCSNEQCVFGSLTSSYLSSCSSSASNSHYATHASLVNDQESLLQDSMNRFSFTSFITDFNNEIERNISNMQDDDLEMITDEEKREYYANKSIYLNERKNRRELLAQRYQNLKLSSSFKIRPRNFS
jgi:hypothetical protein